MSVRDYRQQHRGDGGAYDRYVAGMDASRRQKVALTAAHILCQGRIADMGMGSGTGSHALASLYPSLDVVGVDINETMVTRATERYRLDNLEFVVGDIAARVFADGALDGILNSSVLHHVTTFNDYSHDKAATALSAQVDQLAEHGILIVRDFVAPSDEETVWLDLRSDDGDSSDDPRTCSTATLLERFAREFRKLSPTPGFALQRIPSERAGWHRFSLSHRMAIEFILRKDYRRDWETEVIEEYTYFSQAQFEEVFRGLGLRIAMSSPIRNPWIVNNRFRGKFFLARPNGDELSTPATNYIIVGERAPADEGVSFVEQKRLPAQGYLRLEHYRDRVRGSVMDLAYRPHRTLDVVPYFEASGDIFVLARKSYPRPILCCDARDSASLDGSSPVGYITEPLNVIQTDRPIGQTVERALDELAGISPEDVLGFTRGGSYYPSPGGLQEDVRSVWVEVEPTFVERRIDNLSGFSTSGHVRAIEARQLLRAAEVGGLPDARLELNVYELLLARGMAPGPWIGEEIDLTAGREPPRTDTIDGLARRPPRRRFERVSRDASPGFLSVVAGTFDECDARGTTIASQVRDYCVPATLSRSTVSVALLRQYENRVYIAVDDFDLPAAQAIEGNSNLLVTPAWRLPTTIADLDHARQWIRAQLLAEYGAAVGRLCELGGRYHPSPGATPEVVYPMCAQLEEEKEAPSPLTWVLLDDLILDVGRIRDGHLRISALRAAHALSLLAA